MFTRALFWLGLVVCISGAAAPRASAQEEKAAGKAEAAAAHAADHSDAKGAHEAGDHAGGHHDPHDLSHANASKDIDNVANPQFDMSIYSFLVFLILLGVLYMFAWGPISTALEQRESTIARQIEEARLAADKAAGLLRDYEGRLAAATDEARQIVSQARKDAETAKEKIVAEAREAAGRERDRAVADITVAKNQALDEIAQRSVQTAVSLASNIIRREVRPQDHEALIGEAVNEFSKLN